MVDKISGSPASSPAVNGAQQRPSRPDAAGTSSFAEALKARLGRPPTVRFSSHAQRRLAARQIDFSQDDALRLEQAVEKAANKGARESLILVDDLALVVSIKNKTVITAVDANNRKDNVFTNIDSVVLT